MSLRDQTAEGRIRHVRVDLRGGDAAVAEKSLHVPNVDAFFKKIRGDGVPQHMRCHNALEIQSTRERVDASANALGGCSPAAGIHKECLRGRTLSLALPAVPAEDGRDHERDKDPALAITFPNDRDDTVIEIDSVIRKTRQLAHTHAGRKQELQRHVRGEIAEP